MNKRTLLSVLIAGACVAPVIAQATMLKAESSVPYTMKASDLAKKEKELTDFPLMKSVPLLKKRNAQRSLLPTIQKRSIWFGTGMTLFTVIRLI